MKLFYILLLILPSMILCGEPCGTRCDFIEKEGGRCLSYDCSNTSPDCKKNGKCRISKSKNECVQDVQPECDRYPPAAAPTPECEAPSEPVEQPLKGWLNMDYLNSVQL